MSYQRPADVNQYPSHMIFAPGDKFASDCCIIETMTEGIDLNLLATFCKVAELGSFTRAAQQLRQPKSRVSRAIGRLEAELNVQLIRRTTRQMALTEAGSRLFRQSFQLLAALQSEVEQISGTRSELAGLLRIAAPEDFGQGVLSRLLPRFAELYPEIRFELSLGNAYVDLLAGQTDIAFRMGALPESSLIGRRLGRVRVILLASPQYLETYGRPADGAELGRFRLLDFQLAGDHESELEAAFPAAKLQPAIKSDHFSVLLQMALQHQGIAALPDFYARQDLRAGRLERVLPDWATEPIDLHLLYAPTRRLPLRTRVFIDFVAPEIKRWLEA